MKRQFLRATSLNVMFPCMHPYTNSLAACVLAFIMATIHALLAGENAHPRGQIESEKTQKDVDSSGKAVSTD